MKTTFWKIQQSTIWKIKASTRKKKNTKIIELLFLPITARAIIQGRFRHVFILHLSRVPGKEISSTCSGSQTGFF